MPAQVNGKKCHLLKYSIFIKPKRWKLESVIHFRKDDVQHQFEQEDENADNLRWHFWEKLICISNAKCHSNNKCSHAKWFLEYTGV